MPTKQDYQSAIEKIEEAQELMQQAHSLLKEAAMQTNDKNAEAYLVDQLAVMIDATHGFLSRDLNCEDWMLRLQNEIDDLEDLETDQDGQE